MNPERKRAFYSTVILLIARKHNCRSEVGKGERLEAGAHEICFRYLVMYTQWHN